MINILLVALTVVIGTVVSHDPAIEELQHEVAELKQTVTLINNRLVNQETQLSRYEVQTNREIAKLQGNVTVIADGLRDLGRQLSVFEAQVNSRIADQERRVQNSLNQVTSKTRCLDECRFGKLPLFMSNF